MRESRAIWQTRFAYELSIRGSTNEARQAMIDETPDWLREIIGLPPRFGEKPINCTCAQWYTDGTHAPGCAVARDGAKMSRF